MDQLLIFESTFGIPPQKQDLRSIPSLLSPPPEVFHLSRLQQNYLLIPIQTVIIFFFPPHHSQIANEI